MILFSFSLASRRSKMMRVIKTPLKNEVRIPMLKVVAKPLMGPVPSIKSIIPVSKVVRLESKMAEKAFLYPSGKAF